MIPEGWTETTLGKACTVIAGQSPASQFYNNAGIGIPFYQGKKEFTDKYIGETNTWTTNITKIAEVGDILMSVRAPVGPVNYASQTCCIGRGLAAIKKSSILEQDFLFYFLQSIQDRIAGHDGAVFSSINKTEIENISITFPSLSEQQRIVKRLDAAFADIDSAIQIAKKGLQNTRELFKCNLQTLIRNIANAPRKKLSDVAIVFGRGKSKHRPRNDKTLYGGPYPFIQTGDIRSANHYITSYKQTYNEKGLAQSKLWPKGTLCITIAANIAETGILMFDSCFPDSVIGCVFDNKTTNVNFVEYLLQSFKSALQAKGKGSAQDNINLSTFENEYFPFPDKDVQDSIVKQLDMLHQQTQQLEQIYTQQLADLDELKQSILKKAFNGEL